MIIGYVGPMRSGKTLLMTKQLYDHYLEGKTIYSNYDLNFPHNLIDVNEIDLAIREGDTGQYDNCVFGLDEIHVFMDSRTSGQKRNRLLSYFLTQSGKLETYIYWTSQFLRQVDVRLRLNTQFLNTVRRFIIHKDKPFFLKQDDKRTDFYIMCHKWVLADTRNGLNFVAVSKSFLKNPHKYFPLYDTKQRIFFKEQIADKKLKGGNNE